MALFTTLPGAGRDDRIHVRCNDYTSKYKARLVKQTQEIAALFQADESAEYRKINA
jgi:hypothetical protein